MAGSATKQFHRYDEADLSARRHLPEMNRCSDGFAKQRGAAMWDFINILYREYCLARLNEMRRFELSR
ncbi:hypothetical protein FFI89_018355 [Bradyrhizobium sp. KBS0727]|uniref:hypothetical protein n=1 Tax=unclassified Bradyrhizobium TaxID=2631580 RepID=UPI00110F620E|nr:MULTISPECIES: hypothetical protein [unclassified Bradyrhizobium]QDW38936.1 hypothetical protein FFI71_018355 [Bradyrhizobium sp. KBS0725]QDW45539.1 hypothetical protein FFI89_018355 [Bradyrhizobium sp. KBS0727]